MFTLGVMWDPPSEMIATGMLEYTYAIQPQIQLALEDIGDLIVETAQQNTWDAFKNPTGQLADNITCQIIDWQTLEITVNVPYARRRELGFFGADSLGRVYHDLPEPYLQPAIDDVKPYMQARMIEAYQDAFLSMGVSL